MSIFRGSLTVKTELPVHKVPSVDDLAELKTVPINPSSALAATLQARAEAKVSAKIKKAPLITYAEAKLKPERDTVILCSTNNSDFKTLADKTIPSTLLSLREQYLVGGRPNATVFIVETDHHQRVTIKQTKIVLRELLDKLRKATDLHTRLKRRLDTLFANSGKPVKKKGNVELTCQQLLGKIQELFPEEKSGIKTPLAKKSVIDTHEEKLITSTTEILYSILRKLDPKHFKISLVSSRLDKDVERRRKLKHLLERSYRSGGNASKDDKIHVIVTPIDDLAAQLEKTHNEITETQIKPALAEYSDYLNYLASARIWSFLLDQDGFKTLPPALKTAPLRSKALAIACKKDPDIKEENLTGGSFIIADTIKNIEADISQIEVSFTATALSVERLILLKTSLLQKIDTLFVQVVEKLLLVTMAKTAEHVLHYLAEECLPIDHFRRVANFLYLAGKTDDFAAEVYGLLETVIAEFFEGLREPIIDITCHMAELPSPLSSPTASPIAGAPSPLAAPYFLPSSAALVGGSKSDLPLPPAALIGTQLAGLLRTAASQAGITVAIEAGSATVTGDVSQLPVPTV